MTTTIHSAMTDDTFVWSRRSHETQQEHDFFVNLNFLPPPPPPPPPPTPPPPPFSFHPRHYSHHHHIDQTLKMDQAASDQQLSDRLDIET